jgi:hypothetical protein
MVGNIGQGATNYGSWLDWSAEQNKPQPITYNIPQEVLSATKMYDKMYTGGLPEKDVIRSQMEAGLAGSVGDVQRTADTSAGALATVGGLYDRYLTSSTNLGIQSAQMKQQQEAQKLAAQTAAQYKLGDYREREWDVNVNMPYQRAYNEYWNKKNTAQQFMWGGTALSQSQQMQQQGMGADLLKAGLQVLPYFI